MWGHEFVLWQNEYLTWIMMSFYLDLILKLLKFEGNELVLWQN